MKNYFPNDVSLTPGAPKQPTPGSTATRVTPADMPPVAAAPPQSQPNVIEPSTPSAQIADGPIDPPALPPPAVVTAAEAAALHLTPSQQAAIIQLTSGATRSAAAIAAGVTRTTLYRWLNNDPNFQAAFNAWHKDLITTAQGQLLAASQDAINTVLTAIRRGDARLAWKLLECQGLTKLSKPGSTDIAHLQREAELDKKRADIAERKEINKVLDDDMRTLDPYSSPL
jgi:hypothetical protein